MANRAGPAGNLLRVGHPFARVQHSQQLDLRSLPDRIDDARIVRGEHAANYGFRNVKSAAHRVPEGFER
jgi:hypothetical protein